MQEKSIFSKAPLPLLCRRFVTAVLVFCGIAASHRADAQFTVIMDSVLNNGGFENGATGWTLSNSSTNQWRISTGATAGFSGTQCAYISQSAAAPFAHTYTLGTASTVQFYQDVTLPAGQPVATLSFKVLCQGEGATTVFDYLRVYLAPTSVVPAAGTNLGTVNQIGVNYNLLGANWVQVNISIPQSLTGNATAATTRRLIFQWRNDGGGGTQPPAAVDNIVLTTYCAGPTLRAATNVTNNSALFNWQAMPGAASYQVRYKKVSEPVTVATWATPVTVPGTATSYNATGLTPGQVEYEYQVAAQGGAACNTWSYSSNFLTLCVPVTYAPVPYTEDFESWVNACNTTDAPSASVTNLPSTGNPSWRRDDQGTSAGWTSTNYMYSPAFFHGARSARFHAGNTPAGTYGTLDFYVNCSTITGGKELRFAWINTSGADSLLISYSVDSGATFTSLAAMRNVASWTEVTLPLISNSPKTIIRFTGRGDNGSTDIGLDYLRVIPPCTGTPVAGNITPVPAPCLNQPFQLTVTGTTDDAGITYQWQDSTVSGWQNSPGTTANQRIYTATITGPTVFRLVVSCVNSGAVAVSPTYTVVPAPFINCFCVPTYATGAAANTIRKVEYNGLVNSSTGASPWYTDFTAQQPTPLPIPRIIMGKTDTLKVTFSTNATNFSAAWIDFNHNGSFEAGEYFSTGTNAGASGISNILITPPLTAEHGLTRLRIRGADRSLVGASQPCGPTSSAYGEAEDYYVFIEYPECNGPVSAGKAIASDTAICTGYTVNILDTTYDGKKSLIEWSWEKSTDGGLSWNAVPNSAGKDTLNNVLITSAASYRLKVKCKATGDSTYSIPANIIIKPPYKCYCYSQSDGGNPDVSDIGGVVIGLMTNAAGGPHILNPLAVRRRTDYTEIPNIVMNANGRYKLSVYHIQRDAHHKDARISVFIDFNNDLRYDVNATPNSELVFTGVTSQGNFYLDTAIRIPGAVIPDVPTGLRIILNDDLDPNAPANQGCGPYSSGETEDYVVTFRRVPQGVGNVNNIEEVALYPNPTNGRFSFDVRAQKPMGKVDMNITNITGQVLMNRSYENVNTKLSGEMDLSMMARGIYFIVLRTPDGDRIARKIILQ